MAGIGESWRGAAGLGEPERGGSRMRRWPALAQDLAGPWRGQAPVPDGPSTGESGYGAAGPGAGGGERGVAGSDAGDG